MDLTIAKSEHKTITSWQVECACPYPNQTAHRELHASRIRVLIHANQPQSFVQTTWVQLKLLAPSKC